MNGIKKLLRSITLVLLALLILSPSLAALTYDDIQSIIEQHPYYDPGASAIACSASTTSASAGTTPAGSSNSSVKHVFPVAKGYSPPSDDWGVRRDQGSGAGGDWTNAHLGNDIFAPKGTPALAVTDGVVKVIGQTDLGGNRLWLQSDDGNSYYYAHLDSYAATLNDPGGQNIDPELRVKAGDVLGNVGNTAKDGAGEPHLHFSASHIPFPSGRITFSSLTGSTDFIGPSGITFEPYTAPTDKPDLNNPGNSPKDGPGLFDPYKYLKAWEEGTNLSPTPSSSSTASGSVYFVGDSLTDGMKTSGNLVQKFTAVGRQTSQVEATVGISLGSVLQKKLIDQDKVNVAAASTVVVALGTNDGDTTGADAFAPKIKEMLDSIKSVNPNAQIFWVNAYKDGDASAYGGIDKAIADQAGSLGYSVIDWRAEAGNNTSKYGPFDSALRVHPTNYSAMADFIVSSLGSGGAATGGTSSSIAQCCASGSVTNPVGSDYSAQAFGFLITRLVAAGVLPQDAVLDAAAIVGNFIVESGRDPIDPTAEEPNTHAYGIGQWLGDRLTALHTYADKNYKPIDDLVLQLNYLWDVDLPGEEPNFHVLEKLKAAPTLDEKAISWEDTFERSGGALLPERVAAAKKIFTKYGSNTASSSSNSVTCSTTTNSTGGQVVGSYSLPVDKKWYDQNKEWFTKPHHDYAASDIPVPDATKVYSVSSGNITAAPVGGTCGLGIAIDAGNGIEFKYCHGSDGGSIPGAKIGDKVQAGQLIMHSGWTGHVDPAGPSGTHLHFQIKVGGTLVCPQSLMVGIAEDNVPDIRSLSSSGCSN